MSKLHNRSKIQFLSGIAIGVLVSLVLVQYVHRQHVTISSAPGSDHVIGGEPGPHIHDLMQMEDKHEHYDDTRTADDLARKVRVLCWVMTAPDNFRTKADAVKHTWGRRCNILLFFSSQYDEHLQTIALNVSEGRQHLTAKTMLAFKYVYDNYFNQADWFMKCDDDTYVIVENLRYFLSERNTHNPVYYGQHFHTIVQQGYHSGGAGYVLSKEALKRFATRDANLCRNDGGAEDVEMGKCMEKLGIKTENSTDSLGRSRFHCFDPGLYITGKFPKWYYEYDSSGSKKGIENISDYAVTFHYVPPHKMFSLEFFVYHLRPYGIISGAQAIN